MHYQEKSSGQRVTAEQFLPPYDDYEKIPKGVKGIRQLNKEGDQEQWTARIVNAKGSVEYLSQKDWVVTYADGQRAIVQEEDFADNYQEVEEENENELVEAIQRLNQYTQQGQAGFMVFSYSVLNQEDSEVGIFRYSALEGREIALVESLRAALKNNQNVRNVILKALLGEGVATAFDEILAESLTQEEKAHENLDHYAELIKNKNAYIETLEAQLAELQEETAKAESKAKNSDTGGPDTGGPDTGDRTPETGTNPKPVSTATQNPKPKTQTSTPVSTAAKTKSPKPKKSKTGAQ